MSVHSPAPRIVLVTCARWPTLSASDTAFAQALRGLGAEVASVAWNDADAMGKLRGADLAVVRSSWDYHEDIAAYRAWLERCEAEGVRLQNPPALIGRFLEKQAFAELLGPGVVAPVSHVVPHDAALVAAVMAAEDWARAVLKPATGASGRGVQMATRDGLDEVLALVAADVGRRDLIVQEFLPEIAEGEVQVVLFDGVVSHALRKRPVPGEFRTNSAFSPVVEVLDPLPVWAARVEALVRAIDPLPLYARVDVVVRGETVVLIECEVNEPGLWLDVVPEGAERFARAAMNRAALGRATAGRMG